MLTWLDRSCCIVLVLLSGAHGILGSLMSFPLDEQSTVWHFSGSVAAWLVAVLHWLRAGRRGDTALALWSLVGSLAWVTLMAWFMQVEAAWNDPRPWSFVVVCVALAAFALAQVAATGRAVVASGAR